ncbi:MAG: CBS domain-containing protein [Candidatus Zixiibacteriota bacterium]
MSRRAGDIMIPLAKYPHILPNITIRDAITIMEQASIERNGKFSLPRALLVFDEDYHPLGIVRRRDILKGLEPKFLKTMSHVHRKQMFEIEVDPDLVDLGGGRLGRTVHEQAKQAVSNVMMPIKSTVNFDDRIAKIIYKMVHHDLNLLPVIKDEKVVGVVRSVDVFHEIARELMGKDYNP